MDMIRLALAGIVIIGLAGVLCDQEHIHVRIHVPPIRHDIHHNKVIYKHIKKQKHKISHHSYHEDEDEDEDEDEGEGHEDEDYLEDWERK